MAKPKMASIDPLAAAEVAKMGAPVLTLQPAPAPAPAAAAESVPDVQAQAPQPKKRPGPEKGPEMDRMYVYMSPALAKAIRVHCAGERLSQSDFAQAALARELKRLGIQVG